MSSPRQRYTRLKTDDSDSFTNYVNEYNASQDQQDLLPPPPEFLGNSTGKKESFDRKYLF
jgi:hypothetical protein